MMNEVETKQEETAAAQKKNPWQRLPKGGKIAVIVVGILVVLAAVAALYINGKLDLLRYNDGSVSEMGDIGAEEDQDLDGTGLTHTENEMEMPEGSPFSDDNVLNILLIGTDRQRPCPSYHRGHGPLLPHERSTLLIFQAIKCRSVVIRRYQPHRCRAIRARGIACRKVDNPPARRTLPHAQSILLISHLISILKRNCEACRKLLVYSKS